MFMKKREIKKKKAQKKNIKEIGKKKDKVVLKK